MISKKYDNPMDCVRFINLSYREVWLLNLLVNSKLRELTYLDNNSQYVDPDFIKNLRSISPKLDSIVEIFENDLPF